jgi:hypothetical protein
LLWGFAIKDFRENILVVIILGRHKHLLALPSTNFQNDVLLSYWPVVYANNRTYPTQLTSWPSFKQYAQKKLKKAIFDLQFNAASCILNITKIWVRDEFSKGNFGFLT